MEDILARRLRTSGGAGALWVWLSAAGDVLANAPGVHLDLLWQDLKYARRALSRTPGFAITIIAITALSVGTASAVLTVADRVFFHPLPFKAPDAWFACGKKSPATRRWSSLL